jgi:predicted alpha/beta-hydrolase family hydrolase
MVGYATALASRGVDVVTFNFPYIDATRRVPDRAPILEACFRAVVANSFTTPRLAGHALFIGGKSMGGRIATHLAAQGLDGLRGVVALGYPLHPPGKPDQLRVAHLPHIAVPVLMVQGERDAFGSPREVEPHVAAVPGGATIHAVKGGDHSLHVKGVKSEQMRDDLAGVIVDWMRWRLQVVPGLL